MASASSGTFLILSYLLVNFNILIKDFVGLSKGPWDWVPNFAA